jgi:hypothetical protein
MPTDETLADCERLAHAVCPDLEREGVPVYCVNKPAQYAADARIAAFTGGTGTTRMIRDSLIAAGRWRGPGVNVIFCHNLDRDEALGVTLHELSHRLPLRPQPDRRSPAMEAAMSQLSASWLARPSQPIASLPRWCDGHGLQFHRIALHVHHRAWKNDFEVGLPDMHIFEPYDLRSGWRYMHALRRECERMVDWPFNVIAALRPPREFVALWEEDFFRWHQLQKQRKRGLQCGPN